MDGQLAGVTEEWAAGYELDESNARAELARALDELRLGIDQGLNGLRDRLEEMKRTPVAKSTRISPKGVFALFATVKAMPRVISDSLSGDAARVGTASSAMAVLRNRLKDAGIDVDDLFWNFPDRLAGLRKDFADSSTRKDTSAGSGGQSAVNDTANEGEGSPCERTRQ
jgi:hypothetical protein